MFNNFFPRKSCLVRDIVEIGVQPDMPQMTIHIIWRMRFARRIPKATNTCLANVTLIALLLQWKIRERSSVLCYTYIACQVNLRVIILLRTSRHTVR
jgi:hypothetical protein